MERINVPLVVDLDGTLLKVDSLHEAFVLLVSQSPRSILHVLLALRQGRAAFKAAISDHVLPDTATIPVEETVRASVERARSDGRQVYLATAADRRLAEAVAASMGLFSGVFASENGVNLKGQVKADRLIAEFGPRGFDYIGNAEADLPTWRAARTPIAAAAPAGLIARLSRERPDTVVLSQRGRDPRPYLRAMRPHQWLKNSLIALPAIAGHDFSFAALFAVLIAFASFNLGASSVYLVNDMLDLPHDRAHPEKCRRPFAAGTLPLSHGIVLLAVAAVLSIGLAFLLPWKFLAMLGGYFGLAMAYAFYLKRKLMIDVVALAALYGIRVLAGGAATGIALSHWLIAFSFFVFLSLALVKRAAEMMALPTTSVTKVEGRGYRRTDLATITSLTSASGFVAVLVLALYINSPEIVSHYSRPELLWGVCIILTYWLGRVCFLAGRGEMNQDPIAFAATDWISWLAGTIVAALFVCAI
jgi:4-hydroxybenzoate polyprenyltransferase